MATQTPLERAVEIGTELEAVDTAISQGQVAFSNRELRGINPFDWGMMEKARNVRRAYHETDLCKQLSARREALREELLAIDWAN